MASIDIIQVGMIYETCIIGITLSLFILVLKRHVNKRSQITLLLSGVYLCLTLAIVFSWLHKVTRVVFAFPDNTWEAVPPTSTLEVWFLQRLAKFRLAFFFVTLAAMASFVFKRKVFGTMSKSKYGAYIVGGLGGFTLFFLLFILDVNISLLNTIAFLLAFLVMAVVYFPFMRAALHSRRRVEDPAFKRAYLSLAAMALCFVLVFLSFLLDNVMFQINSDWEYTLFYFLAWAWVAVGMVFGYYGYIRPGKHEEAEN